MQAALLALLAGSSVGGNEVLQHAKDLVNIPKHCKVIPFHFHLCSHSLYIYLGNGESVPLAADPRPLPRVERGGSERPRASPSLKKN